MATTSTARLSMIRRRLPFRAGGAPPPFHQHHPSPAQYFLRHPPQAHSMATLATAPRLLPMKPGTTIDGLGIYKEKDAPVVLERSEYPEWLGDLVKPLKTLSQLKKIPQEEATFEDMQRYMKLERRIAIKAKNDENRKG